MSVANGEGESTWAVVPENGLYQWIEKRGANQAGEFCV